MSVPPDHPSRLPADLLVGLGLVHLLSAPVLQPGFRPLVADGFVSAVQGRADRESALWFVVSGVSLVALGDLGRSAFAQNGQLPRRYGTWVLAAGAVVTAGLPASPGWLVLAIGVLAVRSGRWSTGSGA